MIGHVASRINRRLAWEKFRAGVQAQWLFWDSLGMFSRSDRPATVLSDQRTSVNLPEHFLRSSIWAEQRRTALLRLKHPTIIEPESGYPITPKGAVISEALVRSDSARRRARMQYFSGVPSIKRYAAARLGLLPVRRFPSVVLLRQPFDDNYYHALVEVLPRLALLEVHGLPSDLPLVVSPELARTAFFQEAARRGSLVHRNWVVQDGFYIHAETIYIPIVTRDNRPILDRFLNLINAPQPNPDGYRRFFITRDFGTGRMLTNMEALRPVLDRHHIETIDTAKLSLEEQMNLFCQARLVVGVNGAGLTNILYRRGAPLSLLELFLPHDSDPSFYLLSKSYGYDYNYLVGQSPDSRRRNANFAIDPALLDSKLSSFDLAPKYCGR